MQRIIVIGPSGAGKSTMARELHRLTSIPLVHLDRAFWHPHWQETNRDEWRRVQENMVAGSTWIIDGTYASTLDIRLRAADTVLFLDFPRRIYLGRAVKRWARYRGTTRPDMGEDCPEKIDWEFLRWIWRWNKNERPQVMEQLDGVSTGTQVVRIRTPRQAVRFLRSVEAAQENVGPER